MTPTGRASWLLRPTLRANVVLMVLAMLALPLAIVAGWSMMERDIGGWLRASAATTATEVALALDDAAREGKDTRGVEEALDDLAARHTARVRVVTLDDGATRIDVDHDEGDDLVHRVGTLFFGPDGAPTLRELDDTLGAVETRAEVGAAAAAPETRVESGCRAAPGGKLLVCHAAVRTEIAGRPAVVYVQESSRRAVRALYDLRYHLARLSVVMLPLALLFSWWMGRRMVRPIELLRERVLDKAQRASTRADLVPDRKDEVADLAEAFNRLLAALEERSEQNQAFVADLVHEIKNPAAAIRACAETLASGDVDRERAGRIARILVASSARLDHLVSQFLELARAEAGLRGEGRSPVDIGALARGVVFAAEATAGGVTMTVEGCEDGEAHVLGVPGRLDSVVRNLVDNAVSFARESATPAVLIRVRRDGAQVVLEVTDSGPGIAEPDLPHVFDRFFSTRATAGADEPSARKTKGTGLGLALVKAVVEAHGGTASARSRPAGGATFVVRLPSLASTSVSHAGHERSSPGPRACPGELVRKEA